MISIRARTVHDSPVMILENPVPGVQYIAGIDPIPITTRKESDDTSLYAIAIFRMDIRRFVGYYMERSRDVSRLVGTSVKLQRYFNDAPAMMERNRADAIIMEYDRLKLGLGKLLAPEPADWRPSGAKSIEVGYFKSIHNMDTIDNFLLEWARWYDEGRQIGGIEGIQDLTLLDHVMNHGNGNKDLGDAVKGALIYEWWINEKAERKRDAQRVQKTTKQVYMTTMENGRTVQKLVDVQDSRLPRGFAPIKF